MRLTRQLDLAALRFIANENLHNRCLGQSHVIGQRRQEFTRRIRQADTRGPFLRCHSRLSLNSVPHFGYIVKG